MRLRGEPGLHGSLSCLRSQVEAPRESTAACADHGVRAVEAAGVHGLECSVTKVREGSLNAERGLCRRVWWLKEMRAEALQLRQGRRHGRETPTRGLDAVPYKYARLASAQ